MIYASLVLLSLLLGIILACSAVPKLLQPRSFTLAALEYRIVSGHLAAIVARSIPILELMCAILLCTGVALRVAATGAVILLTMFLVGVTVNLHRGHQIDCNCFGRRVRRKISFSLVFQDLVLISAATTVWQLATGWLTFAFFTPGGHRLPLNVQVIAGLGIALAVSIGAAAALPRFGYAKRWAWGDTRPVLRTRV